MSIPSEIAESRSHKHPKRRRGTPVQHGAMEYSEPPTDLDEVRLYRLNRIRDELKRHDYAGALPFDPLNTRYATDSTNMQIWCMHFETRCVLVMADGPVVLFDYANLAHLAEGLPTIDEYRVMNVFYYFAAGTSSDAWAEKFGQQINDVFERYGGDNRRLAVDRLSHLGIDALRSHGIEICDGQKVTEIARSIKSAGEIHLMEASIDVCQTGMAAMQEALQPGITENALWAILQETNTRLGGEWLETRLLSSGHRTNPWFRECSMRTIEDGNMVCFDTDLIGPYGYCADISRAWVCGGKGNDLQKRLYRHACEQLQHNIDLLLPGASFRDVAMKSWEIPPEFSRNTYDCIVHGVGLSDEWPSIPCATDFDDLGYDGEIAPGMVLAAESYIGTEGGTEGVKLEQMILVTEDGNRLLSDYPLEEQLL